MAWALSDNCEENSEKLLHGVLFWACHIGSGRAWNNVILFLIPPIDKDCNSGFKFVVHDASACKTHSFWTAVETKASLKAATEAAVFSPQTPCVTKIDEECSPCLCIYNGIIFVDVCTLGLSQIQEYLKKLIFSVVCLQRSRFCPNYIFLSGKVKQFKNILTKLVTHKRTLESERRREALLIINQRDSTNFREVGEKAKMREAPCCGEIEPSKRTVRGSYPIYCSKVVRSGWWGNDTSVSCFAHAYEYLILLEDSSIGLNKIFMVFESVQNLYL